MSNLNVEYWFPTPVWNYNLVTTNDYHYKEAINYCNEIKKQSLGRVFSNSGGWQSNDLSLDNILSTPLGPFLSEIKPLFVDLMLSIDSPLTADFDSIWININKKGDKNQTHNHPTASLAGVFYLTENNSDIVFHRTHCTSVWWQENLYSKRNTMSTFKEVVYKPTRGYVLFFPPWLHHAVKENEQDSERISIAFNINATYL